MIEGTKVGSFFCGKRTMLSNNIRSSALFNELSELLSGMDLKVVDCVKNETAQGIQLIVTIFSPNREVNTDDLAEVYNILYPRYSVIFQDRDLSLEVSSPGLTRNLKDFYEFSVFIGKLVRVYSTTYACWVEGYISSNSDESVTLTSALIVDTNETKEELVLSYGEIQKAKLAYRWEDSK